MHWLFAVLAFGISGVAFASCGTAFCMVNTTWNVQGMSTDAGLRADLRFEYIDQDQPMAGSRKIAVGEIRHHHDEVRTINRNWVASLDYGWASGWGVSATLPFVDRDHTHIHNHHGAQLVDTWSFREVGDMRVVGRRQWHSESAQEQRLDFFGVNAGLKLPTGATDIRNGDGDLAERTLQPGTGTTDLLLGAYFRRVLGSGSSWFVDARWQSALNTHEDFKPGAQTSLDVGYRYEATDKLGLMVQLNALHKGRDSGSEAEVDDSGGKFLYVSPGVSYLLAKSLQVYTFVQLPLYQYVSGVQLTADWAVVAGISARF